MPYYNQYMPNGYYYPNIQRPQEANLPYNRQVLQGGVVTSLDEIKAIGIPLDGSLSYFALADGSAIASKQLQQDGTSKIIVYKPEGKAEQVKYVTETELNTLKDEISELKKKYEEVNKHK